jgi:hypothetical protein
MKIKSNALLSYKFLFDGGFYPDDAVFGYDFRRRFADSL